MGQVPSSHQLYVFHGGLFAAGFCEGYCTSQDNMVTQDLRSRVVPGRVINTHLRRPVSRLRQGQLSSRFDIGRRRNPSLCSAFLLLLLLFLLLLLLLLLSCVLPASSQSVTLLAI
ncbi:hypothetical protein E2C01_044331 [Portunus trituberculatus]|uniref:Uncharacterized protein n=1 Tax=Portunus trituberculatus TaxID=210409 RepID=A0A5B7FVC3_PORTR|nr:hypothetical protein [Portunus trituberculatus]